MSRERSLVVDIIVTDLIKQNESGLANIDFR